MIEFICCEDIEIEILGNKILFKKDQSYSIENTIINIFYISQWQKNNTIKIASPKPSLNVSASMGKTVGKGRVF